MIIRRPAKRWRHSVATPVFRSCTLTWSDWAGRTTWPSSLANSPLVAITDDDCLVPADWLSQIEAVFRQHEQVAVVYCNVLPGPHDSSQGFIPDYKQDEDRMVKTIWGKVKARGIGAGMAVRREPIISLGGFDENKGPGARFPSAGDRDLAIRALLKGWWVYETVSTAVVPFWLSYLGRGA